MLLLASAKRFSSNILNILMPGGNKKVKRRFAGLFKYVWPFCYDQVLKS